MKRTWISLLYGLWGCIASVASAGATEGGAVCYPIVAGRPAPGFFEGALLGNGGLGVVVTTRPDAVCLHFGHNNVWDIRVREDH